MPAVKLLEIACFNLESALLAQANGADRIELCEQYHKGGLTPSHLLIKQARSKINIPIHVIIRPGADSFVYSEAELQKMRQDILFCKEQGIDSIVMGVLTQGEEVDLVACKSLLELAKPMPVTFHRAIDACKNIESSFRDLVQLGIDRVLSSGGKGKAIENIPVLKKLQKEFGDRILIMPGGGIRSSNIAELMQTGCSEFHSAALTGDTEVADALEIQKLLQLLRK